MDGPDGIRLENELGLTGRGTLWRATREREGDRIVRKVAPRFYDPRFRRSLTALRNRPHPRLVAIVGEGWSGAQFYLEYRPDMPWETLDAHFRRLHWRSRLYVLRDLCAVIDQWNVGLLHPLGLNARNVVMVEAAGRWYPWLLPCPPLRYSSPCDLFGLDAWTIGTLAPELVRGVAVNDAALDMYALGALALQALGCNFPTLINSDEERVEAQARGVLMESNLRASEIEPFLRTEPAVERLLSVIKRYTHVDHMARPNTVAELQGACEAVLRETDPLALAVKRMQDRMFREAKEVLDWGLRTFGESPQGRILAAETCARLNDWPQATLHLNWVVDQRPRDLWLRSWRKQARWNIYSHLPPLAAGQQDPEGDLLLKDLQLLKEFEYDAAAQDALQQQAGVAYRHRDIQPRWNAAEFLENIGFLQNLHLLKEIGEDISSRGLLWKQTGYIYRRRGDLATAVWAFKEAAEQEWGDFEALYHYGECLRGLNYRETVTQVVREALDRIQKLENADRIDPKEAQRWRDLFNSLV